MVVILDAVGVIKGERERRADGPEKVVMDAHGKEDRTADEKDSLPPI